MIRREWLRLMLVVMLSSNLGFSKDDPGKANIGWVAVTVYHGTNGDPKVADFPRGAHLSLRFFYG